MLPDQLQDPVDREALRAFTAQAVAAELAGLEQGDPVEQLTRAVGETEALAVEYARLAASTPKGLSWRARGMSEHLRSGLDRLFPREQSG